MVKENYRWLAALIAAHPNRRIVGRTRLQKEVKLLQSLGFPTDYSYVIHFYGPYSEGISSGLAFLEAAELVHETCETSQEGNEYYVLQAEDGAELREIDRFRIHIDKLAAADAVVLELAATYDAFRNSAPDHEEAIKRLRRKKGPKCYHGNEDKALKLLTSLGLHLQPNQKAAATPPASASSV
jgi:uncharacterized protein